MIIEFQTTADNFLYQFRETLKSTPMPVTDEQPDSKGRVRIINRVVIGNGTQLRFEKHVDRIIQVPAPGSLVLINSKQTQIAQPVTIEIVYLDDLIKFGDAPSPVLPLEVFVLLDLSLTIAGDTVFMSISYASVEGFLPSDVLASLDVQLRALVKTQTKPLDLAEMQDMLGGLVPVNAGVSCRPRLFFDAPGNVAMRVEFGPPQAGAEEWRRFLNGSYDDLLALPGMRPGQPPAAPSERWSAFVSKDILERFAKQTLAESFETSKKMKLRSDIDVQWSSPGNEPLLNATFKAIAIDACDLGPLGSYDIRIDVQIPIRLSVPGDGVLRQHLKVNFWKNDVDVGACIIGASVFWPIIGASMVSAGKLRWDFYAWLVILVPLRFVVITIKANETDLDPPKPEMKKISDDEFESDQDFSKPGKPNPLVLLNYRGLSTGLVLMGRQPRQPDTCPAMIATDYCEFEFRPPRIPCSHVAETPEDQLANSVTGRVFGAANCTITNVGDPACRGPRKVALQEWEHRILDVGLANRLGIQVLEDFYTDMFVIDLRCPIPPADYYADPKKLQLLVKTNGGARVITYASIEQLTEEQISHLAIEGAAKAINDCKQLIDPWWKYFHRFNPKWHVDPPAFRSPTDRQLWVMAFSGAAPGDSFSASIGERQFQSMRVNSSGQAVMAVNHAADETEALTLTYEPSGHERPVADRMLSRMFMSQIALTDLAECRLSAPVRALVATREQGTRKLYALHDDGFSVIDVSVPQAPAVMVERHGAHLRGAALDRDGLILFGGREPLRIDPLASPFLKAGCDWSSPDVVRVLDQGPWFYVVRERSVDLFDRRLCPGPTLSLPQSASDAAIVGERLVVAGNQGLSLVDLASESFAVTNYDIGAIDSVYTSDFAIPAGSVLAKTKDDIVLLELPVSGLTDEVKPLANFDELPWFTGAFFTDSFVWIVVEKGVKISSIMARAHRCH